MKRYKWISIAIALLLGGGLCFGQTGTLTKGLIGEQDFYKFSVGTDTFTRSTSLPSTTITLNKVGYEVDVAITYGGGVVYTDVPIQSFITAAGTTNPMTALLRPHAWTISNDLTIPSNITLKIPPGALLTIAPGKTLTINGPREIGPYKAFATSGSTVVFASGYNAIYYQIWTSGSTSDYPTYTGKYNYPIGASAGRVFTSDGSGNGSWNAAGAGVTGPGSSVDGYIALFNGVTGAIIKQAPIGINAIYTNSCSTGTCTINWNLGAKQKITLGAAGMTIAFTDLTVPVAVSGLVLEVIQGSGGSKTITTWPGKWPGSTIPVLSTSAGSTDVVSCFWDGTNYFCSYIAGF